tara:strand:+ start:198 stop:1115 length:918 start_codon:yes stop_codon:yes gene_type:complete
MIKSYIIDISSQGMRFDRWLRNVLGKIPQSLIEKSLRLGKIKLNNKKAKSSYKLVKNDRIEIYNLNIDKNLIQKKFKFEPTNKIIKETEGLIIDNNENFVVLNKKSGISVQGGTKSKKNLVDILSKSKIFENTKPFSVHRLDKDTSGVFVIAKNRQTAQLLTSLFRLRKVHKTYLAICHGEIEKNYGEWNDELIRYENGRKIIEKAKTLFKVIDKNINSSLVEMKPITGRKHQLRKQLFNIGCPIYGDKKYKNPNSIKGINKDLMLHSYEIKFMINKKKFTYRALLPNYFKKLILIKRLKFSNLK